MEIRTLTINDTNILLESINKAFADYIIPYQLNRDTLLLKIASENIQLEWSVGLFQEENLIAFMMHGVREKNGKTVVYNAGTGVLPEYRGKGLVSKIYEYIFPLLKLRNVEKIVLEVIESNQRAIRAYENSGFAITRKLLCFSGEIQTNVTLKTAVIRILNNVPFDIFSSFWDVMPSWQSDNPGMDVVHPDAFGAFINEELIGYALFNPANKRLYQIAVAPAYRRKGIATQLLDRIQQLISQEKMQFNNIDEKGENLRLFLEKQGFVNVINQFEMTKKM